MSSPSGRRGEFISQEELFSGLERRVATLRGQVTLAKSGLDITMRPSAEANARRTIGEIRTILERIERGL